jgi:glycosyltransferase involved in cell wall biosynthesis
MDLPKNNSSSGSARTCIVVPAYNEAARLDVTVLDEYLKRDRAVDFLLVNDGSRDSTLDLLQKLQSKWPTRVAVLDLQPNRGKAEAVRQGILQALERKDTAYVGFWDADWATPLDAIDQFVELAEGDPSIRFVIGSRVRLLGRHITRKPVRHYVGRLAATLASAVLGLPVYDTQCGAKLMRVDPETKALFGESFGSRWVFDVELIARYLGRHPGGEGIYEVPLDRWRDVGDSKVRPLDVVGAFLELLRIDHRYGLSRWHRRRSRS